MEFQGEQDSVATTEEVKEEVFVLAPSSVEEPERVLITQSTTSGISSLSRTSHRLSREVVTEEYIVVLPTQESTSESKFRHSTKQVTFSQEVQSTSDLDNGDELQATSAEKSEEDDNDDANFAPVKLYRYLFWGKGKDSATSDIKDQAKEEQITISESQEFEEFPHYQHDDDVTEYAQEAEITSQENNSRFSPRKLAGSVTSKLRGFLQPKQQEAEKEELSVDSKTAETATNETITIEIQQSMDDVTKGANDESAETQENESAENLPVYLVGKFREIFKPSRGDDIETGQDSSQSRHETVEGIVESTDERIETETSEIGDEKNQAEGEVEESEVRSVSVAERIREFLQPKSDKKKELNSSIKSEISELRGEGDEEIVTMEISSQEHQSSEMRPDEEIARITSSTENVKQDSAENLPVFLADRFKGLFQTKRGDESGPKVGIDQVDDSDHPIGEASDATEIVSQDEVSEEGSSSTARGKSISRDFAEGVTSRMKTMVKPQRHERTERGASDSFSIEQAQTGEKGDKYLQAVDVGKDDKTQESTPNVGRQSAENVSVFLAGKFENVLKSSSDDKAETDDREATGSETAMRFTGQVKDGESDLGTISRGVTDDGGYEYRTVEVSTNLTQGGRYVMQESERDHHEDEGSEQEDAHNTVEISETNIETTGIKDRTLSTVKEENVFEEGEYERSNTETHTYTTFQYIHEDFNPKRSEEEKEFHLSEDQSYECSESRQVVTEEVVLMETSTQEQMPMEIGGTFENERYESASVEKKTGLDGEDERLLKEKVAEGKIIGRVEERYNDYTADDQHGESQFENEGDTETEVRSVSVAERVKEFQQQTTENITKIHPRAKSGLSRSKIVVEEEITVSESTLQEQQPTETQQADEKVEQTWTSLENVKQDSAQNLPVLLLDRFKGFFQPKREKATEVNVAEDQNQDSNDSGEMTTELDADSHDKKVEEVSSSSFQDVKETSSTFTGSVTSRLRGLLQPRRNDKEESDFSGKSELSDAVGKIDSESTTEHQRSSDVIVTEETDKSTVTITEDADKESAVNLPVFLAGKFRNIFKTSRDEKFADVTSAEAVDGPDVAATKSDATSADVSGTEVAKEVTVSTENVDKESAENLTVFLAGKFKDVLKSSRVEKVETGSSRIEAAEGPGMSMAEHDEAADIAGDEIRKSTEDVEKESPIPSGEKTNYLKTDPISTQEEEGKVEESRMTMTKSDKAGNGRFISHDDTVAGDYEAAEASTNIITSSMPELESEDSSSVDRFLERVYEEEASTTRSYGDAFDAQENSQIKPLEEVEDEGRRDSTTEELKPIVTEEITVMETSTQEQTPFEIQQQANVDIASSSESNVKQDSAENLPVFLANRFKGAFNRKRDERLDEKAPVTESSTEFKPAVTEEVIVVETSTEEQTPIQRQLTDDADNETSSESDLKQDSAQNLPVFLANRFKGIFNRKREHHETDAVKTFDDGDTPNIQSREELVTEADEVEVESDEGRAASTANRPSATRKFTDSVASTFQGLFQQISGEADETTEVEARREDLDDESEAYYDEKSADADQTDSEREKEAIRSGSSNVSDRIKKFFQPRKDQGKKGEEVGTESVIEIQPVTTEEITVVETSTEEKTPLAMQQQEVDEGEILSERDFKQDSAQNLPVLLADRFKGIFGRKRDEKPDVSPTTKSESSGSNGIVTEEIVAVETSSQELTPTIIPSDGAGDEGFQMRPRAQADTREYVSDFLVGDFGSSLPHEENEDQARSAMAMEEVIELVDAGQTQPYRTIGLTTDETIIADTSTETIDIEDNHVDRETIAERLHIFMESDLAINPPLTSNERPTAAEENQQYVNEEAIITSTKTATRSESLDLLLALGVSEKSDETETYKDSLKSSESETTSNSFVDRIRLFFQPRRETLEHEEAKSRSSNEIESETNIEAEAVGVVESQPQEVSETSQDEATGIDESSSKNEGKETAENLPLYLASRLTGFVESTRTMKRQSEDSLAEQADEAEVTKIASDNHDKLASDERVKYGEVSSERVEIEDIDEYPQDSESKATSVSITERFRQFFQPRRETQDNEQAQAASSTANIQESNIVEETIEIVRSQQEFSEISQNEAIEVEETTSQQENKETAENLPLYLASRLSAILQPAGLKKGQTEGSAGDQANEGDIRRGESDDRAEVISKGSVAYREVSEESLDIDAGEEYSQDSDTKASSVSIVRLRRFFEPRREMQEREGAQAGSSAENEQDSNIAVTETVEVVQSQQEFSEISQNEEIDVEESASRNEGKETAENLPLYLASRLTGILQPARIRKDDSESAEVAVEGEIARVASDNGADTSRGERISEDADHDVIVTGSATSLDVEEIGASENPRRDFVTRIIEIFRPARSRSTTYECPTCGQSVTSYLYHEITTSNKNKLWTVRGVDLQCKLASDICRGVYRTELRIAADGTRSRTEAYYKLMQ